MWWISLGVCMKKAFETKKGPKQECRDLICDSVELHIPEANNILTLPGRKGLCVSTFRKRFNKPIITGIELNEKDCHVIRRDHNIMCYNASLREYIHKQTLKGNHLDVAFLDYFSHLGKSVLDDIESLILNENIIHTGKKTVLAVTLSKSIRHGSMEVEEIMEEKMPFSHELSVENNLIKVGEFLFCYLVGIINNISVELLHQKEYKASKDSAPMFFYCFLIEKE